MAQQVGNGQHAYFVTWGSILKILKMVRRSWGKDDWVFEEVLETDSNEATAEWEAP